MGGTQSTDNSSSGKTSPTTTTTPPSSSQPSSGTSSPTHSVGIPIGGGGRASNVPIPRGSTARDAMEVILSPPGSPNRSFIGLSTPTPAAGFGTSTGIGGGWGGRGGLGASTGGAEQLIPTVFTWTGGGKSVFITGTFNDWKEKIPLNLSEKDFTLIRNLPPGVHQYKFVVDGKWVHAQDQPISTDIKGNVNNFVDVKHINRSDGLSTSPINKPGGAGQASGSPPGTYSTVIPDFSTSPLCISTTPTPNSATSPPSSSTSSSTSSSSRPATRASAVPNLPPHLQRALLNTAPPSAEDPSLLPLPHHVMLNHLYILPKESDDVTIVGVTHRYRTKFVTTVLYKPFVGAKKTKDEDEFGVEIEL